MVSLAGRLPDILATVAAMRPVGAFNVALCNVDRCGLAPTGSVILPFTMAAMGLLVCCGTTCLEEWSRC